MVMACRANVLHDQDRDLLQESQSRYAVGVGNDGEPALILVSV